MKRNEVLRQIPKIDEVLKEHLFSNAFEISGRDVVTAMARRVIDEVRSEILSLSEAALEAYDTTRLSVSHIAGEIMDRLEEDEINHLHGVINATGTILHTNLGRAPLCDDAVRNVEMVSRGYSNLEYDVKLGKRGSRHDILQELMVELTGAEDVMIVNNNASATMLVLSAMAEGHEVVVSRGELVEIGGAFRIPDIMVQSGATLHEVGTTNKTKPSDYEKAINENTGALMKVHTSNYKIMGFTEEVALDELVDIGKDHDLPVIFDMGNGLMVNLSEYGLDEPNVPASLTTGIDVILFSGDKLLGGPQAGIIAGKRRYIEKMKKHPLARALRVDKMTFAAMEETLKKYRDTSVAMRDIPVLRMISTPRDILLGRADKLSAKIREANDRLNVRIVDAEDQIGGGSAPMVFLPGVAVAVTSDATTTKGIERALRKYEIPVIARIHEDELLFSVRTVVDREMDDIAAALKEVE